jgi:hypothetical protein
LQTVVDKKYEVSTRPIRFSCNKSCPNPVLQNLFLLRFFRCLELSPNDPKALFRRCQAYEAVDKVDAAYKDGRECHRVDPNNPALQPILIRLHKAVSEKVNIKYCFKLTRTDKL